MTSQKPIVRLPPPPATTNTPVKPLDLTPEIGALCTQCTSHYSKQEFYSRKANRQASYSNIGRTSKEINTIRANNQEDSALLRLPTELLTMIWKMATESEKATRVHGIVSRKACSHCVVSLVHSSSLLRTALYPAFLEQDTFVVKVSSSDPPKATEELKQWWAETTHGFVFDKPAKPLILMELKVGCLSCTDAVNLAVEVQLICSVEASFHPRVLVEMSGSAVSYYGGPGVLMRLHLNHFRPSSVGQHDLWKGWVATTVTEDMLDKSERSGRTRFLTKHEVLAVCMSKTAWWSSRSN